MLGIDTSALQEAMGIQESTLRTWLTRSGAQSRKLHECFFQSLSLAHIQLDELWAKVKEKEQVPLVVKGEVKGALEVYRRTAFTPDAEWLEFLEALAGQAAITIDNTQLFENLQRSNLDLTAKARTAWMSGEWQKLVSARSLLPLTT